MKKVNKILFAETKSKYEYPYQNWYFPLKRASKKIIDFDTRWHYLAYGKKLMNKKFVEIVAKEKPDQIFMWITPGKYDFDMFLKIRLVSPNTKIFFILQDDDAEFENFSRYFILFADCGLNLHKSYIKEYKKQGTDNMFHCVGIDTGFFKYLNLEKKYEVVFIGCPKSGPSKRCEYIKFLMDNGIKIKLFGSGWEDYPEFKDIYGGLLESEEMVKVLNQTKIYLNLTRNGFGENTDVKAKIFEGGACKTFVLTEYGEVHLDLFKEGKEMIMFNDEKELLKKVKYYLKNEKEREKIAEIAYKKIKKVYSLDVELKRIYKELDKKNEGIKELPKINKKIICLKWGDLFGDFESLKNKIKDHDYIYFKKGKCKNLMYREYLQAFSLEKTKKSISCCDYNVHSRFLGDYLCIFSKRLFKANKNEFRSFLNINQLMVTKDYLLKNLELFKKIFKGSKIDVINENNTVFISFPLIRLDKCVIMDYKIMKQAYDFNFLYQLYALKYQKKILMKPYIYVLFFEILRGKKFIFKAIQENLNDKSKKERLKGIKQ